METKVKVRDLQVKDVFVVAGMLGKVAKESREQISQAVKGAEGKKDPTDTGLIIFQSLFDAEEDLKAWAASLINTSSEEFEKMPMGTLMDVAEQLAAKEDIRDFFSRASRITRTKGR